VPHQVEGTPQMRKDDIIVIVTEPSPGFFTTSYEDVTQYQEYVDLKGTKVLTAIITSRKENVIEGNYDVTLKLFKDGSVELSYVKRQNLAEALFEKATTKEGYMVATQDSVDRTVLKLAYAGSYGLDALDEASGCFERKWCNDYFTRSEGQTCETGTQCKAGECKKTKNWCISGCEYTCQT